MIVELGESQPWLAIMTHKNRFFILNKNFLFNPKASLLLNHLILLLVHPFSICCWLRPKLSKIQFKCPHSNALSEIWTHCGFVYKKIIMLALKARLFIIKQTYFTTFQCTVLNKILMCLPRQKQVIVVHSLADKLVVVVVCAFPI